MNNKIVCPEYSRSSFHCPHCGVLANQLWSLAMAGGDSDGSLRNIKTFFERPLDGIAFSKCQHCEKICIWVNESLAYPRTIIVEEPNEDLPDSIKKDYLEAAAILQDSPRGAAALLRLCIQKLCKELGLKGKNLNADIGQLVKRGLPDGVRKSMDLLRVTGDNAVHPGVIDLTDDIRLVQKLFQLVNFIADKMLTEPKEINALYDDTMPQNAKDAVEKRDDSDAVLNN